jgi:hypothetical protein
MAKNDPCCNINVLPSIDHVTTFQLQPKTCQKPYAKTPQKPHKNPIKIWWDKNFYIFLNINTNKKPKT